MSDTQNDSIRFECNTTDKDLLRAIAERHGRASMSATLRRLIHEEADRLEIIPEPSPAAANPNGSAVR